MDTEKIFEGWATIYNEEGVFTFDKSIFIYKTEAGARAAVERDSKKERARLVSGGPVRVRVELLE